MISRLDSDRGPLNLMIHYIKVANPSGTFVQAIATVLDPQGMAYRGEERDYSEDECTFSPTAYDVRTPIGGMSGSASSMHVTATLPDLSVDLMLEAGRPVLANLGTGLLPFYGNINYEYALPNLSSTGTVTIEND